MSNVQDASVSRLQDVEKSTGSDSASVITAGRGDIASSPLADTVIRRIRIPNNCDMRAPPRTPINDVNKNGGGGGPQHASSVITGQHCDNENVDSALIADKYQLFEQVVGSSLYRCVDVKSKQELVCKIVSRDNYSLLSAHYRLDSQPLVQSLHEVVVGQRYLYLVFPNAHGDLHSYVRQRKRLRESEAKKLFRQICETVQLCHQNGIVLRDLKLRKFVFANQEQTQLKLESFEDAVVLEEPESDWLHDKRGCPAYVSPEILKTGHYSGKGADMWSLGVILYTMLVGRYPFNDAGHAHLFARISSGSYTIPECVSPRARCLIRSLLRREPSERISSEDILYHPWLAKEDKEWVSRPCDQMVPVSSLFDD
ncbi:tribbles homolog 2 [Anthonomus grandis grandis]|uniref:tribbles homolog 2 n=1 Tax=Anthonomus grandis grandis TaxID=2921223 RepID=UPI002166B745|nr:tribbles homolog 2 [Anthonomus grandis grandis]